MIIIRDIKDSKDRLPDLEIKIKVFDLKTKVSNDISYIFSEDQVDEYKKMWNNLKNMIKIQHVDFYV